METEKDFQRPSWSQAKYVITDDNILFHSLNEIKPYDFIKCQDLFYAGFIVWIDKKRSKPAIIDEIKEHLIQTAIKKYGIINNGDEFRIINNQNAQIHISTMLSEWEYHYEHDLLFHYNVPIYQKRKWAVKTVNELDQPQDIKEAYGKGMIQEIYEKMAEGKMDRIFQEPMNYNYISPEKLNPGQSQTKETFDEEKFINDCAIQAMNNPALVKLLKINFNSFLLKEECDLFVTMAYNIAEFMNKERKRRLK